MIDKLSITKHSPPDSDFLRNQGEVLEDKNRRKLYRYMCILDKAVVFFCPHKFGVATNEKIPFTKVDLNPKYFGCYDHMHSYLLSIFGHDENMILEPELFNVTRIDIAVDLEDFNIKHVLSSLHVKHIRDESLNIYKGTIYAGTDPKIRIYNKTNEIKSRLRKGFDITEEEKRILETGKDHTRFEIQIRKTGLNLKTLSDNALGLASYFDRLEFIQIKDDCSCVVMQFIYKKVNRKFRKDLERFKNLEIIQELKNRYIESTAKWFDLTSEPF